MNKVELEKGEEANIFSPTSGATLSLIATERGVEISFGDVVVVVTPSVTLPTDGNIAEEWQLGVEVSTNGEVN